MQPLTADNFGLLIAYLIPGFVTVWAARPLVPGLEGWLGTGAGGQPTVGGFLYVTLASTAAGLVVSAIRWALVDTLHHRTGIRQPHWEFRHLPMALAAFESHVEDHYRYYQFYSNALVAGTIAYGSHIAQARSWRGSFGWEDLAFLLIALILFMGSRDTLRKYYDRTGALLTSENGEPRRAKR